MSLTSAELIFLPGLIEFEGAGHGGDSCYHDQDSHRSAECDESDYYIDKGIDEKYNGAEFALLQMDKKAEYNEYNDIHKRQNAPAVSCGDSGEK